MGKPATIYQYDAFTTKPGMGNPAGVVVNCDGLSTDEMQAIAKAAGFNESAFVLSSDAADYEVRFFSPGKEMTLCGHATIASMYAMHELGILTKDRFTVKTGAGVLPMEVVSIDGRAYTRMFQSEPAFKEFHGDIDKLCASVGMAPSDIDTNMPLLYGSTGTWTLMLPVKSLEICKQLNPHNTDFPEILTELPGASVHPFCMETFNKSRDMHSRHFSTPTSGIKEDVITGTASGVMAAYYATFVDSTKERYKLVMEQGQELGKDGEVRTLALRDGNNKLSISIYGTAAFVKKFEEMV